MKLVSIVAPWKTVRDLNAVLAALATLDRYYLEEWRLPPLPMDRSQVVYKRESPGREDWLTLPMLYELGSGDCEDLSAAFVASYGGTPFVYRVGPGQLHAVVRDRDGGVVDPSRILGMGERP